MTAALVIAAQPKGKAWHNQSSEEVLAQLGSAATGLSATEATKRLAEHGRNELTDARSIGLWDIFYGQFNNLTVWILIVAGVVSGAMANEGC